jgi:hypothetical protein
MRLKHEQTKKAEGTVTKLLEHMALLNKEAQARVDINSVEALKLFRDIQELYTLTSSSTEFKEELRVANQQHPNEFGRHVQPVLDQIDALNALISTSIQKIVVAQEQAREAAERAAAERAAAEREAAEREAERLAQIAANQARQTQLLQSFASNLGTVNAAIAIVPDVLKQPPKQSTDASLVELAKGLREAERLLVEAGRISDPMEAVTDARTNLDATYRTINDQPFKGALSTYIQALSNDVATNAPKANNTSQVQTIITQMQGLEAAYNTMRMAEGNPQIGSAELQTAKQKLDEARAAADQLVNKLTVESVANLEAVNSGVRNINSVTDIPDMTEPLIIMASNLSAPAARLEKAENLAKTRDGNTPEAIKVAKAQLAATHGSMDEAFQQSLKRYIDHNSNQVVNKSQQANITQTVVDDMVKQMQGMQAAYEALKFAENSAQPTPSLTEAKLKIDAAQIQINAAQLQVVMTEINPKLDQIEKLNAELKGELTKIDNGLTKELDKQYGVHPEVGQQIESAKEKMKQIAKLQTEIEAKLNANQALLANMAAEKDALDARRQKLKAEYDSNNTALSAHEVTFKQLDGSKLANMYIEKFGNLEFEEDVVAKKVFFRPISFNDPKDRQGVSLECANSSPHYQARFVRDDEVIRSVKVYDYEAQGTKIKSAGLLQQDNRGKVTDFSINLTDDTQRAEVAMRQAQMLMRNWRPGTGEIIISGADPKQAERVYAALLFLKHQTLEHAEKAGIKNHPFNNIKIRSRVEGCDGPAKSWTAGDGLTEAAREKKYYTEKIPKGVREAGFHIGEQIHETAHARMKRETELIRLGQGTPEYNAFAKKNKEEFIAEEGEFKPKN